MKVFGVVYLIWNMVNGKKYVGQTTQSLKKRFRAHTRANSAVGRAIRKYGKKNFRYGIIKSCASKKEMDYWEKYFIVALHCKTPNGYNLTDGGGGTVGYTLSDETRANMSKSRSGKNHPNYGKKRPPETCAKISASKSGKSLSTAHCAKISAVKRNSSPYKNLTAEPDKRQFTYTYLAELMGIHLASVFRKMLGKCKFLDKDKVKLVEIFGLPIEYLLERTKSQ